MRRNLIISIVAVLLIFAVQSLTASVRAMDGCMCDTTPGSSCYPDGCTRKTIQGDGSIIYDKCRDAGCGGVYNACYINGNLTVAKYFCVTQPPCCADMIAKNDAAACCWPERAFCHPFFCKQVSSPERCGWYWTFHQDWTNRDEGYGCMKGSSESTMVPIFGLPADVPGSFPTATTAPRPTSAPPPTTVPVIPTNPPSNPTYPAAPTSGPVVPPVNRPDSPSPTPIPFSIGSNVPVFPSVSAGRNTVQLPSFPSVSLNLTPRMRVGLRGVVLKIDKGFQAAGTVIASVHEADLHMESQINTFLAQMFAFVANLFGK